MEKLFQKILDFFFPLYCVVCSKKGCDICKQCLYSHDLFLKKLPLKTVSSTFYVYSFLRYSDNWVKKLIKKGKYKFSPYIFSQLTVFVLEKIKNSVQLKNDIFSKDTILVPVPLHYFRKQKRGYNQSQIIAECIKNFFPQKNLSVKNLVLRTKNTSPQAKFSRTERIENIKNAFVINKKFSFSQREKEKFNIILIDDVVSTGSTLAEIQKVLKKEGYKKISGLVLARSG